MAQLQELRPAGSRAVVGSGVEPSPIPSGTDVVLLACKCRELTVYFRRADFRHTILGLVSEQQILQWADEAEAGYDVEEMKRRGRGRPGRGAEPMQVVAVRLTPTNSLRSTPSPSVSTSRDPKRSAGRLPASPREGPRRRA
jgi:hypothetical protein